MYFHNYDITGRIIVLIIIIITFTFLYDMMDDSNFKGLTETRGNTINRLVEKLYFTITTTTGTSSITPISIKAKALIILQALLIVSVFILPMGLASRLSQ